MAECYLVQGDVDLLFDVGDGPKVAKDLQVLPCGEFVPKDVMLGADANQLLRGPCTGVHRLTTHKCIPEGGLEEANQHVDGRCLASPIVAQQGEQRPFRDTEGNPLHRAVLRPEPIVFDHVAHPQHVHLVVREDPPDLVCHIGVQGRKELLRRSVHRRLLPTAPELSSEWEPQGAADTLVPRQHAVQVYHEEKEGQHIDEHPQDRLVSCGRDERQGEEGGGSDSHVEGPEVSPGESRAIDEGPIGVNRFDCQAGNVCVALRKVKRRDQDLKQVERDRRPLGVKPCVH
mmetsp:Transcript_127102/g.219926  ORF Transcript_127102/g.219926 Transcript_127102/m.219926 type:complete len:287 (+) Transcript_127102:3886-4746(+)